MSLVEHIVETPGWIRTIVDDVVVPAVTAFGFMGTLGYRYWMPDSAGNASGAWQVAVYPSPNEARGGPHDGARYTAGFRYDIGAIIRVMTAIENVVWEVPAKYNGHLDGPEVSVRGTFLGNRVWLRFFHLPPPDEPSAYAVDQTTGLATELSA